MPPPRRELDRSTSQPIYATATLYSLFTATKVAFLYTTFNTAPDTTYCGLPAIFPYAYAHDGRLRRVSADRRGLLRGSAQPTSRTFQLRRPLQVGRCRVRLESTIKCLSCPAERMDDRPHRQASDRTQSSCVTNAPPRAHLPLHTLSDTQSPLARPVRASYGYTGPCAATEKWASASTRYRHLWPPPSRDR